jgi:uncharacterized protein (DUF169 family)
MSFREAADRIATALGLDLPPVGLAFVDSPPAGVADAGDAVPSACSFWRRAERGVFFAPAAAHFNCPIGAFVLGFDLPPDVGHELQAVVGQIVGNGYIGGDEPASLPRRTSASEGILYGPLASFPVPPDLVLLWLTPAQAMIWNEAAGAAAWGAATPSAAFGRPACAALPASLDSGRPALSLGCMGMRTFTGIAQDRLLAAAPGDGIADLAAALEAAVDLNGQMRAYYEGRRAQVSAAART